MLTLIHNTRFPTTATLTAFLRPALAAQLARIAGDLQALPRFRGRLSRGVWTTQTGLAVGYLSWNLDHDRAAETVDLVLAVSLPSRSATTAGVTLDLVWSDGWLIAQFLDQPLTFAAPADLIAQLDALIASRQPAAIALLARALDGEL
jgi:hypothetical protein